MRLLLTRTTLSARARDIRPFSSSLRAYSSLAQSGSDSKAIDKEQPLSANDHYKLLIIGAGWAGYQLLTQCNKYIADIEATVGRPVDIEVISRRNVSGQ